MKVSKNFVILFLVSFLVVILGNVVALSLNFYKSWMGYLLGGMFVVLFLLIFRKHKVGFIRILAWVLPILFVLVVMYINFLPFGYSNSYSIAVAENGSVSSSSSDVWFEDLKGKKITNLSDVYSLGQFNLVVKPKIVLKGANVSVSINGTEVYLAKLNFSVGNNKGDYSWDFTKGIPSPLNGTTKYDKEKGCVYFNGSDKDTLSYPNSSDMFENDSFIVYAKWKPEDMNGTAQQIIGHYNWELWQNNDSVRFMVGRLEDKNGSMPSVNYPINGTFFNLTHEVLAIYKADKNNSKGYIELYVDGNFAGRKNIQNQTIWTEYNLGNNLTSGWSPHNYGNNSYYTGCIYNLESDYTNKLVYLEESTLVAEENVKIPLMGTGNLTSIKIDIKK